MKQTERIIAEAFYEATGIREPLSAHFLETIDSITKVQFMLALEDRLGKPVSWTAVSKNTSMDELVCWIEKDGKEYVIDQSKKI